MTDRFTDLTNGYVEALRAELLEEGALRANAMLTAAVTHLCLINNPAFTVDTLRSFVTTIERFGILMDGEQPALSAIN